jgi:hypothetical protein
MTFNCQRSKQHQGGLNRTHRAELSKNFRIHKLEKIVAGGEGIKKYPARQCKACVAYKGLVLRNTTQ